jgi:hypothetical protein
MHLERNREIPEGVEMIDHSLKVANSMQRQKRMLEEENEKLLQRIEELEKYRNSEDYERAKFMEGAVWMARKSVGESEKMCQRADELL